MSKGILLNGDNDVEIRNGSVVTGERMMQDAYMVLGMNQGELKDDPLTGANPLRTIRGKVQPAQDG